jgi:hypothetical protein
VALQVVNIDQAAILIATVIKPRVLINIVDEIIEGL